MRGCMAGVGVGGQRGGGEMCKSHTGTTYNIIGSYDALGVQVPDGQIFVLRVVHGH